LLIVPSVCINDVITIFYAQKIFNELLHNYTETKGIDHKHNRKLLKWLETDYNQKTDKIYYKYPKRKNNKGAVKKIKTVKMGKPSKNLIEAYESKRSNYQDKKNKEFYDEIKEKVSDSEDEDSGKTKEEKIKDYIEDNPEASGKEVSNKFDTSESYVYKVKSQV
jgi:hypothetical protein